MKRLTIMTIIVMLLASVASGITPTAFQRYNADWFSNATGSGRATGILWMRAMELAVEGAQQQGTGLQFYVDSGVSNAGDGSGWDNAVATVEEAVALCEANRGDVIYVAQGHAESFTAAAGLTLGGFDADIAGISIIGMGQGDDRPTFTFADTDATVAVGAASIRFENLVFLAGISEVVAGVIVEAAGVNFTMFDCEFPEPIVTSYEFNIGIQLTTAANDVTIAYCTAYSADATGADHWINGGAGVVESLTIIGNIVYGEYAIAPIFSDQADLKTHVAGNVVGNMTTGQLGIEFSGNATGWCYDNLVVTDTVAASYDTGVMDGGGGDWGDEDSSDTTPVPWTTNETGVNRWGASELEQMEAEATDALEADHIDHLFAVSVADEIADDSYGADIAASDGDWSGYDKATDSLEAISDAVGAISAVGLRSTCEVNSGGATKVTAIGLEGFGNNYFNTGWSIVCIYDDGDANAAPEGEIRDITGYVSATGVFTVLPAFTAAVTTDDMIYVRRNEDLNLNDGAKLNTSGNIWYVDDGGNNSDGLSWQSAMTTLFAAEALCGVGDTIFVGKNHTQSITTGGDTINVAGVSVIGMGEGDSRPVFIFDAAADELTLSAAGITLKNLRFQPGATVVTAGIVAGATGIGCTIEDCAFIDGAAAATDEFIDSISVNALAAKIMVRNCTYVNTGTDGHTNTFLNLDAVTVDNPSIVGCTIYGDFAEAAVWGGGAVPVEVLVADNVISNINSGDLCIEFAAAATGVISGNKLYADTFGAVLDPGSCSCIGNYATNAINTSAYLVPSIDDAVAELGPGRAFYVDSGTPGAGDGRTWSTAVATLDAGVNLCTTLRTDTIYVAAGHTEAVTTAFADLDLSNITVIGLGDGKSRPYFDYTGASGSLLVNADNVTLRNMHFHANVDSTLIAVTVETGSENVLIEDCLFTTESATDEFDVCIGHAAGNHGAIVRNCEFRMGAAEAVSAVHFLDSDYAEITGNETSGDYSTACIHNETTASDHIMIRDNQLFNGTIAGGENTEPGIELLATTSGMIVGNNVVCLLDTAELSIVAADCHLFDNEYNSLESGNGSRGIGLVAGRSYVVSKLDGAADDDDLFSIAGGPIQITKLYGYCTVEIGAACTITIVVDHATLADTEYTDAVDIDTLTAGGILSMTAANPSAIAVLNLGANLGSSLLMDPWLAPVGMIEIVDDGAGTTGNIEWYMTFVPLVNGVTVTPQ